jgi:sterol desaturase/sphingolipid hydroxylase (fatty acid hydroxylase superfamily)
MLANATATAVLEEGMFDFIVTPVATWTWMQLIQFPIMFIIPAEFLAGISTLMVHTLGSPNYQELPHRRGSYPELTWKDHFYVYFNRFVMLPFLSWLIVKTVWASDAVVYDMNEMTIWNTVGAFAVVFSMSDLVYYTGHRIVHKVPLLYGFVHKHHHGESHPTRGWYDTCNAHPTDFFYTGWSTSPISTLWIMPAASTHIVAIGLCLWINSFVGALGHCRLDLNWGVFNTRFHAGHHSKSNVNFAQNIELWDRFFGTYHELDMSRAVKPMAKTE